MVTHFSELQLDKIYISYIFLYLSIYIYYNTLCTDLFCFLEYRLYSGSDPVWQGSKTFDILNL